MTIVAKPLSESKRTAPGILAAAHSSITALQTMTMKRSICPRRAHRGNVLVEFAVVLPLLVFLLLGTLEMGRALNVKHTLQVAARAGCRMAVLKGSTLDDIETLAQASLQPARIGKYQLTVTPQEFQNTQEGDPITVTIASEYSDVSWFAPLFLNGGLSGSCTMRTMRRTPVDYPEPTPGGAKKGSKKVAKKAGKKANKKQTSLSFKKNKKT